MLYFKLNLTSDDINDLGNQYKSKLNYSFGKFGLDDYYWTYKNGIASLHWNNLYDKPWNYNFVSLISAYLNRVHNPWQYYTYEAYCKDVSIFEEGLAQFPINWLDINNTINKITWYNNNNNKIKTMNSKEENNTNWAIAFKTEGVRIKCVTQAEKLAALDMVNFITQFPIDEFVLKSTRENQCILEYSYVGVATYNTNVTAFYDFTDTKVITYSQFMEHITNNTCPFVNPAKKIDLTDNLPVVTFKYKTDISKRIVKVKFVDDKYLEGYEVVSDGHHQYKRFIRSGIYSLTFVSFDPNTFKENKKD